MTTNHGTEVSAFDHLEIAIFVPPAVHVTETTDGSVFHSISLAPFARTLPPVLWEGASERAQRPTMFPVHNVSNVAVATDQPCGLPCSVTQFCFSFDDLHGMSVLV